jgi:hypothetical protein
VLAMLSVKGSLESLDKCSSVMLPSASRRSDRFWPPDNNTSNEVLGSGPPVPACAPRPPPPQPAPE